MDMKVAVDVDGTIGRYPALLGAWMSALKRQGHTVVILTGNDRYRDRHDIFRAMGICPGSHYDALVVVPGSNLDAAAQSKAEYLRDGAFHAFIDDFEPYCQRARDLNPGLLILRVCP